MPEKQAKQLHQLSFTDTPSLFRFNQTPSGVREKLATTQQTISWEISEVQSRNGESLCLLKRLSVDKGAEYWLPKLKEAIGESLKRYISTALNDLNSNSLPVEELALKYPAQVGLVAICFAWTKEVEAGILEMRNERKTVNMSSKKFGQIVGKFLLVLSKSRWTSIDKPLLNYHKLRLEAMISVKSYSTDYILLICILYIL